MVITKPNDLTTLPHTYIIILFITIILIIIVLYKYYVYDKKTMNNNLYSYNVIIHHQLAELLNLSPALITNIKYLIPEPIKNIEVSEKTNNVKLEKIINIEFDIIPIDNINKNMVDIKIKNLIADEKFILNIDNNIYKIQSYDINSIPKKYKNINYDVIKKYNFEEFNNFLNNYSVANPYNSTKE